MLRNGQGGMIPGIVPTRVETTNSSHKHTRARARTHTTKKRKKKRAGVWGIGDDPLGSAANLKLTIDMDLGVDLGAFRNDVTVLSMSIPRSGSIASAKKNSNAQRSAMTL